MMIGKNKTHGSNKDAERRRQRGFFSALFTLSAWRLRQTWWLLLMAGVSLCAALAIACIAPLFSTVAANAGLQGLLTSSSARSTMDLTAQFGTLSTSILSQSQQRFDRVVRAGSGSYLDPSVSQVITVQQLVITQPARLSLLDPLNMYATSIQRLEPDLHLVAGNWASEHASNGVIDIMLAAPTAQALHLTVGTTMTLQAGFKTAISPYPVDPRNVLHVRLAGIFAAPPSDAPALFGETFQPIEDYIGTSYTLLMSDTAFLQVCDQLAANEHSPALSASGLLYPFQLNWYYHLRPDQLSFAQIDDLASRFGNIANNVSQIGDDSQFFNPAPSSEDLLSLLQQYTSSVALVRLPVMLLAVLIMALLLFFACLLANLLVDRQMAMSALLSSRGASQRQLLWSLALQGIGLCVLAPLLGPVLGALAVFALAHQLLPVNEQVALAQTFASRSQLLALVAPYVSSALLVGLLVLCLPFRRALGVNILELRRETTRTTRQPFWLRYYLDIFAALLALSSFGIALYLANVARALDLGTQELLIAPLTLLAPVCLLLGCLLLFLRIFPLLLRFAARRVHSTRGATAMLALAQIERAPRQTIRLTMLLALAVAFVLFSLTFTASQNQRAVDIAGFESGADFAGTLPVSLQAQFQSTITKQYLRIPGIQAASVGYIDQGNATGLNDTSVSLQMRAVDAHSFANTAFWDQQDSSQSLKTLMNLLLQKPSIGFGSLFVPAIVDETTLYALHVVQGGVFTLQLSQLGNTSFSFQVVAVVQHIPTVNGIAGVSGLASSGGVLVDYQSLAAAYLNFQTQTIGLPADKLTNFQPNYVWLRTSNTPAALASVRSALNGSDLALSDLNDRREIIGELQRDPLSLALLLMLSIGGIAALALALLGNLAAAWLNVRLRLNGFVVLRALGATKYQIVGMLLWEQGIVYLLALALSLGFGALLTWLAVPSLVFTDLPQHGDLSELSTSQLYLLQRMLPPQIVIPPVLGLAFVALLLACMLALFLMTRTVLRASFAQELRLNED
jgi:ABC-type antimicrobial peptide transport system permease subunit